MTLKKTDINSEPERKLSLFRVFIAIQILVGLIYSMVWGWNTWREEKYIETIRPWFAAYVDVTATPTYAFEQLGSTQTPNAVLSFIVSSKDDPCTPTWGTAFTLEEANNELDVERRIARLAQQEGRVAISFGGALNDELALHCNDHDKLLQAYKQVIDLYQIDTIDLDLENEGLNNNEAMQRRAKVLAKLQQQYRDADKNLAIWLTLPVAPQGLTKQGTDAVTAMLTNDVDLAGVNVMTMNYNNSRAEDQSMLEASKQALMEIHRQLGILYDQAEIHLSSATLWRKIGATPMIGQNDSAEEVFTVEDAKGLNDFAIDKGLGRMSMWSANRDIPCGENYVNMQIVSDSCSGLSDDPFSFANALSKGFDGDISKNSELITVGEPKTEVQEPDDPATSPYQVWQEKGAYLKGTKVVWHGNVYESKWWTKGDLPDNPVLQAWETPWQLIGPVLPGEEPIEQPKLPTGYYPEWSGTDTYQAGQRVIFEGTPYQAKWWTQGDSPAAASANADNSPWVSLTMDEIKGILDEIGNP